MSWLISTPVLYWVPVEFFPQQRLPAGCCITRLYVPHLCTSVFHPWLLWTLCCVHFGPLQVWQWWHVRCSFLTVKGREGNTIVHKLFPFCPPSSVSNRYPIISGYFSTLSRASCKHTLTDTHLNIYNIKVAIKMPKFPVPKHFHGCINIRMDDRPREGWQNSMSNWFPSCSFKFWFVSVKGSLLSELVLSSIRTLRTFTGTATQ